MLLDTRGLSLGLSGKNPPLTCGKPDFARFSRSAAGYPVHSLVK